MRTMETRFIGYHVGCGGEVFYTATPRFGYRECKKCKANGMRGTLSPDVTDAKPA